uniref:Putative structural protein n=1 Tax=viral metagenome TaxID=1070528 RepID=A0A6M3LJ72_9ZZZZ
MGMKALQQRIALGSEADLTVPTSDQLYPLGYIATIEDSATKTVKKFIYVKANGALTAYVPLMITWSSTTAAEVTTTAVATMNNYRMIGIPQQAFTSGYYGFLQIYGDALSNCGATPTIGHTLKVTNGAATVLTDESGSAFGTSTVAIAKEAGTTAAAIFLIGSLAIVA